MAFGERREDQACRDLGRHILCGVYSEVDLIPQQGLIELAGKDVALVYGGERRLRVVLAGRLYYPDFHFEARVPITTGRARFTTVRCGPCGAALGSRREPGCDAAPRCFRVEHLPQRGP